jgi:hypothetical protein
MALVLLNAGSRRGAGGATLRQSCQSLRCSRAGQPWWLRSRGLSPRKGCCICLRRRVRWRRLARTRASDSSALRPSRTTALPWWPPVRRRRSGCVAAYDLLLSLAASYSGCRRTSTASCEPSRTQSTKHRCAPTRRRRGKKPPRLLLRRGSMPSAKQLRLPKQPRWRRRSVRRKSRRLSWQLGGRQRRRRSHPSRPWAPASTR